MDDSVKRNTRNMCQGTLFLYRKECKRIVPRHSSVLTGSHMGLPLRTRTWTIGTEHKGTVLLSLEVLRLFAEIAKLPIIIIVDILQEVKNAPEGRRGAYCTPPSVGQFVKTEEPSPCLPLS